MGQKFKDGVRADGHSDVALSRVTGDKEKEKSKVHLYRNTSNMKFFKKVAGWGA